MAISNTVTVTGNVTRTELRFTPAGSAVLSLGLAVNRRWMNKQTSEWEEEASFFDVTCWDTLAENVNHSAKTGTRLTVTGRLEQRTWETESGEQRSKVQIVAEDVAVSLRWATAQVEKNESNSYSSPPSAAAPTAKAQPPVYDPGEEPF